MIVAADWLLPGDGEPIREGAVFLSAGRIADVGALDQLTRRHRGAPITERPDCVLSPGLVNAHTHLSLTALQGLIEPAPFHEWLPRLVAAMRGLDSAAMRASAGLGALQCLAVGVTAVGDIAYGPEAWSAAAGSGIGGVFFRETLGIPEARLAETMAASMPLPAQEKVLSRRSHQGVSPHAVYTASPRLLQATRRLALERGLPYALHAAESLAELQLLADGTGPLAGVAQRVAFGFQPPKTSLVDYLEGLGVLDGAVLVHGTHLSPGEIRTVAARARGVVLCPRSNAYLRNGRAPVDEMLRAGVPLALGTDSSASNEDLDLFAEARALRALAPRLSARTLVRMMTAGGARVLSLDDTFGRLRPGCEADLVAVRTGPTNAPEESFLEAGSAATVDSVLSGGIWRVVSGRNLRGAPALETPVEEMGAKT